MRNLTDWLQRTNAQRSVTERLLPAALVIRAVALTLGAHPDMNGFYVDGAYQPSPTAHVGVAISLRGGGVIAPAVREAQTKNVDETMRALADLIARSRAGRLRRAELADPTITVTNLGDHSVDAVQPVIYGPQVAIIGVGQIRPRPWVENDQVTVSPVATFSLAADHRVSDGHSGARFLAAIGERLQHPDTL